MSLNNSSVVDPHENISLSFTGLEPNITAPLCEAETLISSSWLLWCWGKGKKMGGSNFFLHTLDGLIMGGPQIKKPQSWGKEQTTLAECFVYLFFFWRKSLYSNLFTNNNITIAGWRRLYEHLPSRKFSTISMNTVTTPSSTAVQRQRNYW